MREFTKSCKVSCLGLYRAVDSRGGREKHQLLRSVYPIRISILFGTHALIFSAPYSLQRYWSNYNQFNIEIARYAKLLTI